MPIDATPHSTVHDILEENTEVEAAEHDWECYMIVLLVTGDLNIGDNVGDSIWIGDKESRGYHSFVLNDATFFHSTCYDRCVSLLIYLFSAIQRHVIATEEEEDMAKILSYMPYDMLIENATCRNAFSGFRA